MESRRIQPCDFEIKVMADFSQHSNNVATQSTDVLAFEEVLHGSFKEFTKQGSVLKTSVTVFYEHDYGLYVLQSRAGVC